MNYPEKEKFIALIDKIVDDQFPDESTVYHFEKEELIKNLYSGQAQKNEVDGMNHAGTIVGEVLGYISSVLGTFKLMLDLNEKLNNSPEKKEKPDEVLKAFWIEELKNAGLPPEKAQAIADRFHFDALNVLKK